MRLLTIPESAKQLAVSERTIRRLIEHGTLDAVRIGRTVRITQEALDAFIAAHSTGASA